MLHIVVIVTMWSIIYVSALLLLWHYKTIEITSNEITDNKAWIER